MSHIRGGTSRRNDLRPAIGGRKIIYQNTFHTFLVTFRVLADTFHAQPWQQRSERFALSARGSGEIDMSTIAMPQTLSSKAEPVAPWFHTIILAFIFLGLAAAGAIFQRRASAHPLSTGSSHILLYLSVIAMEYGLFRYVSAGLARRGVTMKSLIGGSWNSLRDVLRDAGLALGIWVIWSGVERLWGHIFDIGHAASIQTFLPRKPLEIALWIVVSMSAGISEEIAFRGYFQRQFGALTGNKWAAVCLQAVLFGVAHGYQGIQATARIALFGALFGVLAIWRGTLRPGIMAHAFGDILSGIFGI
jgi:membrane protease YdiL (CAAX protease family)